MPKDIGGARALAEADKHEFEQWAISLVPNAQPWKGGKKGADKGIDGVLYVQGPDKKTERAIISVKGGQNIGVAMIRDLKGVLARISQIDYQFDGLLGCFCYKNQCNTIITTGSPRVPRRVNPKKPIYGSISTVD